MTASRGNILTPRQLLETVLSPERAQDVLEHRLAKRCKLTRRGAKRLAEEFAKCPDPDAAADHMILMGWQGFYAEWMNGGSHARTRRSTADLAREFNDYAEHRDNVGPAFRVIPGGQSKRGNQG